MADAEAVRRAAEDAVAEEVYRALRATADEAAVGLDSADEITAAAWSVRRIASAWRNHVPAILRRLFSTSAQAAVTDTADEVNEGEVPEGYDDLGARYEDDILPPALDPYLVRTEELLNAVGDHLAERAARVLNEGIEAGDTVDELKLRMLEFLSENGAFNKLKAQQIAMTEATRAWNASVQASASAMAAPDRPLVKQWRTQGDGKVREPHREANGQIQFLDEPFNVGGFDLAYPGDPTAPADLTVNCRCYLSVTTETTASAWSVAAIELQSNMPPQLKRYWLSGEGAAKIGWGTEGSFDRCVSELRDEFPDDTEGLCANLYHEATGHWPGRKKENALSAAGDPHPGGMIALIPTAEDAERLAIEGGEPVEELHCTLYFLTNDASEWSNEVRAELIAKVQHYAQYLDGPVQGRLFGVNLWNPDSDAPAWVWPVGDMADAEGTMLNQAHNIALDAVRDVQLPEMPANHTPWVAHVTAQYSGDPSEAMVERIGPVTFDRIRVVFGGEATDIPLVSGKPITAATAAPAYAVGDRVTVTGEPHEEGQTAGTIEEINQGPAYGIVFDGTDMVHKWYVGEELTPESKAEPMPEENEEIMAADPSFFPTRTWSTPGETALAYEDEQTGDGRVFAPDALFWEDGPWPLNYCDSMDEGHRGGELAGSIQEIARDGNRITGTGNLYMTQEAGWEAAMLLDQEAPLGVSVDIDDVDLEVVATGPVQGPGEDDVPVGDEPVASVKLKSLSMVPLAGGGWSMKLRPAGKLTASGTSFVSDDRQFTIVTAADGTIGRSVAALLAPSLTAAAGDPNPGAEAEVLEVQDSGAYLTRITRARVRGATLVTLPAYSRARIVIDPETPLGEGGDIPIAQEDVDLAAASTDPYTKAVHAVWARTDAASSKEVAEATGLPLAAVRAHLVEAVERGHLVKLGRRYVAPKSLPEGSLTAAVTGATDLPVAPRDTEWDGDAAASEILDAATDADGNIDVEEAARGFLWHADEDADTNRTAWKLPFARPVDGTLTIIPDGVVAIASVLQGGRGGVDVPEADMDALRGKVSALYKTINSALDTELVPPWDADESAMDELEASAWTAMRNMDPMPAEWFKEPTAEELPPGSGGVHYKNGRVYGWVAQSGVPHASYGSKVTIDKIAAHGLDTSHFLRAKFDLDDGTQVRAGAFTMDVGHHRDGAECETAACQFDSTRTVAAIITVGVNKGGMWFSGAASPWVSDVDRRIMLACQPSYHMKQGSDGKWQLRAVLSVPVPGHSSPLLASFVERTNMTLAASAAAVQEREALELSKPVGGEALGLEDTLAAALLRPEFLDALTAAMNRRAEEHARDRARMKAEIDALSASILGETKE